ncbi:hypothetical protein DBR44_18980 [Aquitalea sp. FJL05]|uniref:competence protein CoiA family protein n=1 Tax=Aquitalea sp. FJL05 TaxID=2153366 RepID=UPI000F5A2E5E|nr:competence protein CoiA family protein [Aquitalea sp. FJL05]RQO65784.1 hypothetical protein DBR44_18980 [Aquitalea sp. FJL05]
MQHERQIKQHGIPFGWHVPTQRMVDASSVANGLACECICSACSAPLQAKQGTVRAWHFAHHKDSNCQHAAEAAVHRMAKQLIEERQQVYVPERSFRKMLHGEKQVWSEEIAVTVQGSGVQVLTGCVTEKTIYGNNPQDGIRRPDVLALLDGHPLAIEIRNTHEVDTEKAAWLKQQGYSVLEIDIADIAFVPMESITTLLERRLFANYHLAQWLCHAGDDAAKRQLIELEADTHAKRHEEELFLLAEMEAKALAEQKRNAAWARLQDVDDFRLRLEDCTVRIGRNIRRVSLKVHGFTAKPAFSKIMNLAHRYGGQFNKKGQCWEFHPKQDLQTLFLQLCSEAESVCLGTSRRTPGSVVPPATSSAPANFDRECQSTFRIVSDADERFEERAAILQYDGGFSRQEAEELARQNI